MLVLLRSIKARKSITLLSSIGIFFLLPLLQMLFTPLAWEIWFTDLLIKPLNSTLYIAFSFLFGAYISLYIYSKKNVCIECNEKSSRSGLVGSALGFLVGVCPACFSFLAFLLPLGTSILITAYSPIFTLIAIIIIAYSIYKLGGFKSI